MRVQREGSYLFKGTCALTTIGIGRHNMTASDEMFQQASLIMWYL